MCYGTYFYVEFLTLHDLEWDFIRIEGFYSIMGEVGGVPIQSDQCPYKTSRQREKDTWQQRQAWEAYRWPARPQKAVRRGEHPFLPDSRTAHAFIWDVRLRGL